MSSPRSVLRKPVPARSAALVVTAAAMFALLPCPATAAEFPDRPLRMIVVVPPGAGSDILARTLAGKMTESMGQQVVVDNRSGASGMIGMEIAARAAPDGYTLVQGTVSTLAINPALIEKMPYNPVRDFAPISLIDDSVIILVVNAGVPAKTVPELIALAKQRPGGLRYGSAGVGSIQHLVAHMFRAAAGIDVTHVPYKGAAPIFADLMAGHIEFAFSGIISATSPMRAGKVRALAVASLKRVEPAPDVPTLKEAGGPDLRASLWNGILAPARTPAPVIARLNAEIVKAVQAPDYIQRIRSNGGSPVSSTPAEFATLIRTDLERYTRAVRETQAKAE